MRSERGQMAIFVALIFQVLFVFFAMTINVGLIVHDKINLQNSVDLAAYYAAQRQAEMLNAIAHYNYQIRQAWKLLTFRYRVLGDLGFKEHPLQRQGEHFLDLAAYADDSRPPNVCVNHGFWGFNQNLCYNSQIRIPQIPKMRVINPFLPINFGFQDNIDDYIRGANTDCKKTSEMNFTILINWLLAYRYQIAQSKGAIRKYAGALAQDTGNFSDIRGESVLQGVQKTLTNNLTRSNLAGLQKDSLVMFNSLGGQSTDSWLHEVLILPRILYTHTEAPSGSGCSGVAVPIDGQGVSNPPDGIPSGIRPNPTLDFARMDGNTDNYLYHSSFGYEKNPWMMAYVGVRAETAPRKPFLPFGKPIKLTARAFAKPFGGRVGPWFYKGWPRGSRGSVGSWATQVDPLMPTSYDPEENTFSDGDNIFPNYGRFPGDALGLRSQAALAILKKGLNNYFRQSVSGAGGTAITPISPAFYSNIAESGGFAVTPQGLQGNTLMVGYLGPWIRDFEVAAVAPDLFDATYYSIEPSAWKTYIEPGKALLNNQGLPMDLGSLIPSFPIDIKKQIEVLNQVKTTDSSMNFYLINNWKNLLTGWSSSGPYEYDFPEDYARCLSEASLPVPGACISGGRVGYSVKIISRDYLMSPALNLGGGSGEGPLLNPPPF